MKKSNVGISTLKLSNGDENPDGLQPCSGDVTIVMLEVGRIGKTFVRTIGRVKRAVVST